MFKVSLGKMNDGNAEFWDRHKTNRYLCQLLQIAMRIAAVGLKSLRLC